MISPGIHLDLSNADYHADKDYLSSSVLKAALPERYKAGGSQDALDFGTLFHAVVLEPEKVDGIAAELGMVVLDAKVIGVKADGSKADNPTATTAWKNKLAEVEADGLRVMPAEKWVEWLARAEAMRDAAAAHEQASALLFGDGTSEVSLFWQPDDGPGHKARFDRLLDGCGVDLKSTTAQPGADALTKAVLNYGYDTSAAHYLEVANGLELGVTAFWLVFVSKEPPHYVTVCNLSDDFLTRGRILRALAIERLTNPATDQYPGAEGHLTLTPPPYARITDTDAGIPVDFTWSIHDYA